MFRKVSLSSLVAVIALALTMVIGPAKPASAQQGITWSTGFQVQNLSQTSSTTVVIKLVNPDGSTAAVIPDANKGQQPIVILAGQSEVFYPVPNVTTFKGSAIISATQPVAAILNIQGNAGSSPFYSESVTGITKGSTEVNLPLILRNNGGNDTWFAVQNTADVAANVTVQFTSGGVFGKNYTTTSSSIPAGAAKVYDQELDNNLGDKFVGSAVVRGSQPLAVVVNQISKGTKKVMYSYSGFASGAGKVALPLIQQSNGGNISGISIQNAGSTATTVTVTYSANLVAGGATLTADTATLDPGESTVFLKGASVRYVGSATITTSNQATDKIVAVVNQLGATNATAYEGFDVSALTPNVSLPLLLARNGGSSTGVQCINLGGSSATITITYGSNKVPGGTNPTAVSRVVKAGDPVNFQQDFASRYVGGGTVKSSDTNGKVACIVNQLNSDPNAGDAFLTYDGVNFSN